MFEGFLAESILDRAITRRLVEVHRWDLRDWAEGRHRQVDDRPFGGGPGMVLMAPPVVSAIEAVRASVEPPGRLIALTPQGRRLDQSLVRELAGESRLLLLCGRYEGFDERILELLNPEQVSIGDYVLSGGEVPAMVLIDAIMRLVPGVLGDEESTREESFSPDWGLEHPHYTRPRVFRGLGVPEVLLGGNHALIARWRQEEGRRRTLQRRQDLATNFPLPDRPTRSRSAIVMNTPPEVGPQLADNAQFVPPAAPLSHLPSSTPPPAPCEREDTNLGKDH